MDLASNLVTFLGLLEAVLRAGSIVYEFIAAVQDAPKEVRNLQHELNGVNLLLSELKDYWNDLSRVQSWSSPSSLVGGCISSLRSIHQDLDVLATATQKHDSSKRLASTWAKVKWVFEKEQVLKLTRCLERHKLSLVAALAVDGKRMQLYYQQELKQSILQSSERILSGIASGSGRCHQGISDGQTVFLSSQTDLELKALHIAHSASKADSGFQSVCINHRRSTTSRRKVSTRTVIHSKQLDALHADVKHLGVMLGRFDISPSPACYTRSFGRDHEDILLSLLLLRPQMHSAIESLLAEQHPGLSDRQLNWLGSELSLLLTAVKQNSDFPVAYDRSVPRVTSTNVVYHTSSFYQGRYFTKVPSQCTVKCRGQSGHKGMVIRIWRFESTIGRLDIRRTTISSDEVGGSDEDLGFTFTPFLDTSATAVIANFQKKLCRDRSPQIQRQLHTYTVLPYRECRELYTLLETGSLSEIDEAFRHGRASPYVLDFVGRSIHYPAARAGRLDVLQYLANQGFGPATVDAGSHALRGLCELWRSQAYSRYRNHKRRDDIFRWLVDSGCDVNYSIPLSEGPVQYNVTDSANYFCHERFSLFQHWITLLRQEGYNLETRNFAGETALLSHAGTPGAYNIEAIQWLLTSGADPQATNPKGFNSLVCTMLSTGSTRERYRNIIRSKLRCLIAGGCEISQCDLTGLTPSQHAVRNSCWYEWCYALEYNGWDVLEVIKTSHAQQKTSSPGLSEASHRKDLLIDNNPLSSRLQLLPRKNLLVDSYDRYKRTNIVVFVYFMVIHGLM
ncbi:hypothetical protein MMC11_000114 [Xylographa trunciseda]|nr:hypothetical protein [Xylographa trunciseda]